MWQVIAHGAREIAIYAWYPMNSGFESNGYGLINLDGTLTDRAQVAGSTAQIIQRHAAGIDEAQPVASEVAVLYDRLSYLVGGSQPSLSNLGNAERDSLLGVYRAFFEEQIPVDFVHPAALRGDSFSQYRIVFLPYPVMLSESVADQVKQYVTQGGTAVAEARLGWNNERGFASPVIPGFGLDQIFGAREKLIRPEAEPQLVIQPGANLPGFKPGDSVTAAAFEEHLQPLVGAQVLALFPGGEAAMVEKAFGRGKTILVGSFAGLAYQRKHDRSTSELFLSLAQAAGVAPEVLVSGPGTSELEVRRLASADQQFVFIFNHANAEADASISLHMPWKVNRANDLTRNQDVPVEERGNEMLLQKNLAPGAIWVVLLERQ